MFLVLLGIGLLSLNLYAPGKPTIIERVLASFIIVGASVPAFLWLSGRERGIPLLTYFGGIYSVYYALPIFLLEQYSRAYYIPRIIPHTYIEQALLYSLVGLGALYLGYYSSIHRRLNDILPRFKLDWGPTSHIRYVSIFLGILGIFTFYIKMVLDLPLAFQQAIELLKDLSLISMVLLFVLQLDGRLRVLDKCFLWGLLVPTRLMLAMGTGATAQVLEVVLILVVGYTSVNHRIPWKIILMGAALFFLLRTAQVPFRTLTWNVEPGDLSPQSKFTLYLMTINEILTGKAMSVKEAYDIGTSRLSHLMTFAEITGATPDFVPYWLGETYYPLLFKIIPRFLYPDKPLEVTGQTFGHRYSFLAADDYVTSYNLPQLIEFYANFGVFGVILGMVLLGVFYRVVQQLFFHSCMGFGALVGFIYITTKLLLIESSLSMVVGGLFWIIIYFGVIDIIIKVTKPSWTVRPT
jgi:hypothetical protein